VKKAIFFDKDGTLIENIPFNVESEKIKFNPGAIELIRALKGDFDFHIITNQAGIAFGHFEEFELKAVKNKMQELFEAAGAKLSGFHYCPHHPEGQVKNYAKNCLCRKPGTKLIEDAANQFNIDLAQSWLIGDILDDIEAGNRSGMRTILLNVGNETEWDLNKLRTPHHLINQLEEALPLIKESDYG